MAGEEQYIHPIIAAMGQLQNSLLTRQQLTMQQQQYQSEQAARAAQTKIEQQRADQAQQQIENEHEFHSKTLEQQHAVQQAQMELLKMQAIKGIRDEIAAGIKPEALANSGSASQPGQNNTPGIVGDLPANPDTRAISLPGLGLNIPISTLPSQQDLIANEANRVGAIAAATQAPRTQAEKELEDIREKFEAGQLTAKQAFEAKTNALNLASREKIARLDTGSQYAIAKMRTDAEYGPPGEQSNQIGAYQTGLATGELQPNMTNPIERRGTAAFINNGGRIPSKEDAAAFGHLGGMQDVYNKMNAVANMLPDEKTLGINSAKTDAATLQQLSKLPVPTDFKEAVTELAPSLQTVVRNTQQTTGSRFNPQEMQNMQNLIGGLGNVRTKQQFLRAKQSIQDTTNGVISNSLENGMGIPQQNIIYQRKGVTPKWIIDAQNQDKLNPQGHTVQGNQIDIPTSIKLGKPAWTDPNGSNYDPQTGAPLQ